jgi:hypothetical protein
MAARRPPWWILGLALAFLGYYLLLFYCDARRPEGDGIQFTFAGSRMIVTAVDAGTAGARAGIAELAPRLIGEDPRDLGHLNQTMDGDRKSVV